MGPQLNPAAAFEGHTFRGEGEEGRLDIFMHSEPGASGFSLTLFGTVYRSPFARIMVHPCGFPARRSRPLCGRAQTPRWEKFATAINQGLSIGAEETKGSNERPAVDGKAYVPTQLSRRPKSEKVSSELGQTPAQQKYFPTDLQHL
ncbi:hypothetical protein KM043_002091 [Ampulex compressa]|nr:hypothetical protein KM043_002091 [Ampulex compressa]